MTPIANMPQDNATTLTIVHHPWYGWEYVDTAAR